MEHKSIWTALHAAKQELGKVPKDSTNPFFKSKYFDINGLLDVVEPIQIGIRNIAFNFKRRFFECPNLFILSSYGSKSCYYQGRNE